MIDNAAREPEMVDVADCLNKMGAKISGAGTSRIMVDGVARLSGARHSVLPDRIETGTYAMAVAMTGGDMHARRARGPNCCSPRSTCWSRRARRSPSPTPASAWRATAPALSPVDVDRAVPRFPDRPAGATDGADVACRGKSRIVETIFENRFMHVQELARFGARISARWRCRRCRRRRSSSRARR